jgi:hypothetical protein
MLSVKKDFAAAQQTFVLRKFFEEESIGIAMSIVFIAIMALTMGEWINIKPIFKDLVRIIFVLGGAIGSWAFMLALGKSKTFIRDKIGEKINSTKEES